MNRMAYAMGLGQGRGSDIPSAIKEMNARLGLPSGLAALGVQAQQFGIIIQGAEADHCHKTNPVLASTEQYMKLLTLSM